jgi:EpsI family protein
MALAIYAQTITRVYHDGVAPIMLLVAYSATQNGFLQVHRPEFCYTAGGFALSDFAVHDVQLESGKSFRVNTLSATRDAGGEKLLYWTCIGNHIPLSWTEQKIVFAEDNLRKLVPDSALIRVSTPLGSDGAPIAKLDEFVRTMIASVAPPFRRVFVV